MKGKELIGKWGVITTGLTTFYFDTKKSATEFKKTRPPY